MKRKNKPEFSEKWARLKRKSKEEKVRSEMKLTSETMLGLIIFLLCVCDLVLKKMLVGVLESTKSLCTRVLTSVRISNSPKSAIF